nr:MAG TPA: hypothetical protein [Caudoviricetes sp.]
MNYAKSYIDCYRAYAAAVAAEKAARAALENEYSEHRITQVAFDAKLAAILETAPKEAEFRKKADKIVADFDAAYSAWIAPDGSKVDEADLKVLNPVFITSAADLQHIADRHNANPTMAKPIREYAVKHSLNVRILDVEAPLKAMNTLKLFAQKALNDFDGYSANCLKNDKFCQRLIDLAAVMDGKIVLANTFEE